MALPILQELLQDYLQSLLEEHVLNNQFCEIVNQKRSEENVIVDHIRTYCVDMEALLSDVIQHIAIVDFDVSKLVAHVEAMEEKSSRIGAENVRIACAELIQAYHEEENGKKSFARKLTLVRNEYSHTKDKLDAFIQMERKISRLKNKQKETQGHAISNAKENLLK